MGGASLPYASRDSTSQARPGSRLGLGWLAAVWLLSGFWLGWLAGWLGSRLAGWLRFGWLLSGFGLIWLDFQWILASGFHLLGFKFYFDLA